jgi:SAM-dependent methyltransferase
MDTAHWTEVWGDRDPDSVTWFQAHPERSARLIESVARPGSAVVDVGGGASRLVDHLIAAGYTDLTVLDIAEPSLAAARCRLGDAGDRVSWIVADVTATDFGRVFDVWHDRAAFHFLVDDEPRGRYLATLRRSLCVGGHLVLATFGPDGPERCSGLPVRRYGIGLMQETLGEGFELVTHELEDHVSPAGVEQQFLYAVFRRAG